MNGKSPIPKCCLWCNAYRKDSNYCSMQEAKMHFLMSCKSWFPKRKYRNREVMNP